MSIPDYQTLMLPLLEAIGDGKDHSNAEINRALAERFEVTEKELQELLPSGLNKVFYNRVAWAKYYLRRAGLLECPPRAPFHITQQGESVLAQHPEKINIAFLKRFSSMDWHKKKPDDDDEEDTGNAEHTPDEVLESSFQELCSALAAELLEKVRTCSWQFFQRLVLDLLVKMGYGGSRAEAAELVGCTGDGGIDGIINEDMLGLDFVCIQTKHWLDARVGSPLVREFIGSMESRRASKGVFVTTSFFTGDAKECAKGIGPRVVLIDGKKLAQLMIEHGIGVATVHTYEVKKIDLDYFEADEG